MKKSKILKISIITLSFITTFSTNIFAISKKTGINIENKQAIEQQNTKIEKYNKEIEEKNEEIKDFNSMTEHHNKLFEKYNRSIINVDVNFVLRKHVKYMEFYEKYKKNVIRKK